MVHFMWYLIVFMIEVGLVVQLLSHLAEREINFWEFLAAIILLLGLNGFMLTHASDAIGPCVALLIIAFAALYRLVWRLTTEHQLAAIRAEDLAEYKRAIEQRPDIPYPYQRIGDYYFEKQMWAEAAAYYEKFLQLQKDPEVEWKLEKAKEELARELAGLRQCPACREDVPRDAKVCPHCGHYLRGPILDDLLSANWRTEVAALATIATLALVIAFIRLVGFAPIMLLLFVPVGALIVLFRVLFFARKRAAQGEQTTKGA